MSVEKSVESAIKEAQARGDFDKLKGKGKPLDLSAYFETPEELRLAYATLKNAGYVSPEVELLQDLAALREMLSRTSDDARQAEIKKRIRETQLRYDILMDRQRKLRKG